MIKEQKLSAIRKQLDDILEGLSQSSKSGIPLHKMERRILTDLLKLGLLLLRYYVDLCSSVVQENKVVGLSSKGNTTRRYLSVFGELSLTRPQYYHKETGSHYPLDAYLGLPSGKYSYLLEDLLSYGATEMDFEQSSSYLNRILGHNFSGMQSKRCSSRVSSEVDGFYDTAAPEQVTTGEHLSVGFDGKGVPMILSELGKTSDSPAIRLSKGQKRGSKKEATVSLSSSFTPKSRSPKQIIDGLFKKKSDREETEKTKNDKEKKHSWHDNKHLRAFLSDKPKAIHYGLSELLDRDTQNKAPIVVLIDGDRALKRQVATQTKVLGMDHRIEAYVLDFIHLLEYVWKVANIHLGEKHQERTQWVETQALLLLNSKHAQVLEGWKNIRATGSFSKYHLEKLDQAITYLTNKEDMVDYKTYLSKGFPITTGAVESACGHFVKSRMERNAMHWSFKGAQSLLDIRAVRKNLDWDKYMKFFIEQDQKQIYQKTA